MAEHELKCDPEPFNAVWEGRKLQEVRFDDRNFQVNDTLKLKKTSDNGAFYQKSGERPIFTGQELMVVVKHIQQGYGLLPGWCIMSIQVISRYSRTSKGGNTRSILPEDYE